MLYTPKNSAGALVIDVDRKETLRWVLAVNTRAGWVKVGHHPIRLDAQGRMAGERIRFNAVYAIQGMESRPCLFHCYGRKP